MPDIAGYFRVLQGILFPFHLVHYIYVVRLKVAGRQKAELKSKQEVKNRF